MVELLFSYKNETYVRDRILRLLAIPLGEERPKRKPRQDQTHLSPADQQKLVDAYKAGNSVYDLATMFVVTRQTAAAILERNGIKRKYKVLTPEDVENATRLYAAGASLATLGEYFGVDPSTVRKAILGAGGEMRPVGTNAHSGKPNA